MKRNLTLCMILTGSVLSTLASHVSAQPLSLDRIGSITGEMWSSNEANWAVSPISIAAVMGVIEAGTQGRTKAEIQSGLGVTHQSVAHALRNTSSPSVRMATQILVKSSFAEDVQTSFREVAKQDLGASIISFETPREASNKANSSAREATSGTIKEILPEGTVNARTASVIVNAIHFKSAWREKFSSQETKLMPFQTPWGLKNVPTMVGERSAARGRHQEASLYELPFSDGAYSLVIAVPDKDGAHVEMGQAIRAMDLSENSSSTPKCEMRLPKFKIEGKTTSIKDALKELGARQIFSAQADLTPMFGASGKNVRVDDVFHSASVTIDETGGEAAGATAVVIQSKSFSMPKPLCAVDRAFQFAIVHTASRTPIFLGSISDPNK